jgi:hypothetical protein
MNPDEEEKERTRLRWQNLKSINSVVILSVAIAGYSALFGLSGMSVIIGAIAVIVYADSKAVSDIKRRRQTPANEG